MQVASKFEKILCVCYVFSPYRYKMVMMMILYLKMHF